MTNTSLIESLAAGLADLKTKDAAIALDFDGVCKLFTAHKHQIMSTLLFLHLHEFQRVPFDVFKEAYGYINFRSAGYAGKERFLCADALARYLTDKGYDVRLPGLHGAVDALLADGKKIAVPGLEPYKGDDAVARALAWSEEVNGKVARLTEIGLTPGIKEHVFDPFRDTCDCYVVSTAAGEALPPLLEKEGIGFIKKYMGQETATKAESLTALGRAGYATVFMFGDSVEDTRASTAAAEALGDTAALFFVPVIPGDEERCFAEGEKVITAALAGDKETARRICGSLAEAFAGNEVGNKGI